MTKKVKQKVSNLLQAPNDFPYFWPLGLISGSKTFLIKNFCFFPHYISLAFHKLLQMLFVYFSGEEEDKSIALRITHFSLRLTEAPLTLVNV